MHNNFKFFDWPIEKIYSQLDGLRKEDTPLRDSQKKTKYPIRTLRYWWVICAIQEFIQSQNIQSPTIIDAGCDRGILKRIIPPINNVHWTALDLPGNLTYNEKDMEIAQYDTLVPCDLDQKLPLPDSQADIVICLHVLEHLPCPEFTMKELARIVRPGGIILYGFPILPKSFAKIREKQFAHQFRTGKRHKGEHTQAFWPKRAAKLAQDEGLDIDFLVGSHLIRNSGSFLENFVFWIRMNQFWGALFPSFGQELCVQAKSPS